MGVGPVGADSAWASSKGVPFSADPKGPGSHSSSPVPTQQTELVYRFSLSDPHVRLERPPERTQEFRSTLGPHTVSLFFIQLPGIRGVAPMRGLRAECSGQGWETQ